VIPYEIITNPQRSPEWHQARLGRLTGSVASDMLATIKNGEAAARRNLRTRLVLERLTGKPQESGFVSNSMQDGIDREAEARGRYEALTGELVTEIGFLSCRELMVGVSLDGIAQQDSDGHIRKVIELKCPTPAIHLSYLRTGRIPADYMAQIVHSLWVTGAESCDWMSYNPDFPEGATEKLVTVPRDEAAIAAYDTSARAFLVEVEAECAEVRKLVAA